MLRKPVKTLSLFTGGGGLDIGFHKAGFNIFACVEIEKKFCETLELNKPKYFPTYCKIINADIRELEPQKVGIGNFDFIIGGPPCQSFSAAGRRAGGIIGVKDERGSLFEHYCKLIKYFKPKGFLFENVRGIISANKKNDWNIILKKFYDLGYKISYRVLDAADYGSPQHRERLILVGTKMKKDFLFPRPNYGPDSKSKRPYVTCGKAMADLQDENEPIHDYPGKYGELLKKVPPGSNYLFFTKEMGYPNPRFAWRSRFSDFLYKANPDQVVKTIVAKGGAFSGPFHWKNRKFNLSEYKRLFTFPDEYKISGGYNVALQQLGNSVVPVFAEQLAKTVIKQVFDVDIDIDLLPSEHKLSFDRRKAEKARRTRAKRLCNQTKELPLFFQEQSLDTKNSANKNYNKSSSTYYCCYPNWKVRIKKSSIIDPSEGRIFKVKVQQLNGDCNLTLSRFFRRRFIKKPLLRYNLKFHNPIGNGLRSITCKLISNQDQDIVAAWDAIEDVLNTCSGYSSMIEVFGHFTEPHPCFNLKLTILNKRKRTFLLNFAEYFSKFSRISVDYSVSKMSSFFENNEKFEFLDTVKWLRSMRFDVRVFETNRTIKPGFFRCCYPFTLNVNKQVSVSWKDTKEGNIKLNDNNP
jgi:DNA (cytosine-5)-methyltransferase 1